jgi:hypothetical protein
MESTELIPRVTIREFVQTYVEERERVRAAIESLKTAQSNLAARFQLGTLSSPFTVSIDGTWAGTKFDTTKALARLERDAWKFIVDRLDIWRIMSVARANELRGFIDRNELPEISEESVEQLARQYIEGIDRLVDEYAREVFDHLRPRSRTKSAKYKTNRKDVVGDRAILTSIVDTKHFDFFKTYRMHDSEAEQRLRTIENLFLALDGKGSTGKGYRSELQSKIEASKDGIGQTEYFAFRACQNGNLHLSFRRPDLVAELNRRAGGMNLRSGKR